jgi:two-component system, response regulator PdtaR
MLAEHPLRAVICEDEWLTVRQLRNTLVNAGYEVVGEAKSGESGCELTRKLEPDFVLMDVNLQGMNGIDSTREIMRDQPTAVIMLTAYDDEETVRNALDAGAVCYVVKPIIGAELIQAIKTAMSVSQVRPRAERFSSRESRNSRILVDD